MPKRASEGVIKEICKYCEETEVPSTFAVWSGIFSVAAALGRDCFIDQGYFVVYPNLYVVLVAGSAKCRKSTSIEIANDYLKTIKPPIKLLSQKLTPEALISVLSGMNVKDESKIIDEAVGAFVNDEISTLIDKNSFKSGLIPVLTKLYDCKDFTYETKSRGKETVRNPCLSILGGSTLHWIREAIPVTSIGGGFTSRIVFVFRSMREKSVPWPVLSPANRDRAKRITHDLNELHKLRGGFDVNEQALEMYCAEYDKFLDGKMGSMNMLSGYANRRHTMLLKIAMAMSASKSDSRVVTKMDMWQALQVLKQAEVGMPTVLRAISSEPVGDICEYVIGIIMEHTVIERGELLRLTRHKLTARDLDSVLEGLLETKHFKKTVVGGVAKYKYTGPKGEAN